MRDACVVVTTYQWKTYNLYAPRKFRNIYFDVRVLDSSLSSASDCMIPAIYVSHSRMV